MEASSRRKRFARSQAEHPLTPHKLRLLRFIAECGILTTGQLAQLSGFTDKSTRGHLRDLFDLGLVERIAVPRAALTGPELPNDAGLLYGSAPTIHRLSKEGVRVLIGEGIVSKEEIGVLPDYGPKNALFLAHELEVREVRVWLERLKTAHPEHQGVLVWRDGKQAVIDLKRATPPRQVRPDAWFVYRLKENGTIVGLVEVDRGTERSPSRWQEKFVYYAHLLAGNMIQELTGQQQARVLILAPDAKRRDGVATVLQGLLASSQVPPDRFWVAERSVLERTDLREPVWRIPEREGHWRLVPEMYDRFI